MPGDKSNDSRRNNVGFGWKRSVGLLLLLIAAPLVPIFLKTWDVGLLIDPGILSLVVGGTLLYLFVTFPGSSLLQLLNILVRADYSLPEKECQDIKAVLSGGIYGSLGFGMTGVIIHMMIQLKFLNSPEHIGPAMAGSLLAIMYSVLMFLFFTGVKLNIFDETGDTPGPVSFIILIGIMVLLVLSVWLITVLSMSI